MMRNTYFLFVFMLCCGGAYSQSPISLNTGDMPVVGGNYIIATDTMPVGFTVGAAGANRVWNYPNLNQHLRDTLHYVSPASTPYSASFPNANLALTTDFTGYVYYRNNAQSFRVEGLAGNDPTFGQTTVVLNPATDQYRFSIDYQDNFSGSYNWRVGKRFSDLPQNIRQQIQSALPAGASVDSVRVIFNATFTDTIDAWGTFTTPLGAYDCLRRKRTESNTTRIDFKFRLFPIGPYTWSDPPISPVVNGGSTQHEWLSDITKIPLVTVGYDTLGNVNRVNYSLTPPPPAASFTWNNPSGGLVSFTNTSTNNPQSYSWDFGDSGASTQQNPTHIYAANGSYYVCLTATNASGSDTYCDSVYVTKVSAGNNRPVAVRDSAQIVYPASATIDLLANDLDPDGDNISYVLFFPPLNGNVTHLGSGVVRYDANAGFRGIDSFLYIIQDDGTPSLRDTGTAVIRVDGLPFANFTWSANGFDVQFVNTSSGYDNVSWDLGDGATANTNTVVHTYARGSYTVCLTATNTFGSDDTCRTVDLRFVGVDEAGNPRWLAIYPNPVQDRLNIAADGERIEKIEIADISGKLLVTQRVASTGIAQADMSAMSRGIYFCRITFTGGQTIVSKIVRE